MLYVVMLVVVALAVLASFIIAWWGGPILVLLGIGLLLYLSAARKQDRTVGTVETGRRREPTGTVRSGSADVETANQRQGQE